MLRDLAVEQEVSTGKINISALSRQTGLDRKTVRKHIQSSDVPKRKEQYRGPGKLEPYKTYIKARLDHYPQLSGIRIFEELRSQGYPGGYTLLKDYLRTTRPRPTILPEYRYETKPGVQAQVDWAECNYCLTDQTTHKTYCFSMICGYSRMRYIEFTQSMDLETFLVCHQHAFEYFGGVTQEILYDNIKVVVLRRGYPSSESIFYPPFVDFKNHYGFKARLCRPYRAKTKGKIERSIRFIKDNFLYGREFCSLNDLNLQARIWMDRINNHEHGTTHEIPTKRLLKEQLTPYASFPQYLIRRIYERQISKDCYISLYGNRYSVQWRYAGQKALVEVLDSRVIILVGDIIVGEHPLLPGRNEVSRLKDHFEGHLKAILNEPLAHRTRKACVQVSKEISEVQKRDLSDFDKCMHGDP